MDEKLFEHLRDALNNLYDAEHLRSSPLVKLLGFTGRADTSIALQKALEQLIQALKPRQDDPGRSQKRRMYDLLYSRYIDQFSQREVANQLGISLRSYQREQKLALDYMVSVLAEKYPGALEAVPDDAVGASGEAEVSEEAELEDEFAWMFAPSAFYSAELEEVISTACHLAQPLASHYNVSVCTDLGPSLPRAAIHPQALQQITLNVLLPAIHQTASGQVMLRVRQAQGQLVLTFSGGEAMPGKTGKSALAQEPQETSAADRASLAVAQRLTEKAGGSFRAGLDRADFIIKVDLPTVESIPVLVIDDSSDNIKLIQRYLSGTRYQMNSLSQPEMAIELVEQAQPQIVVLDLMMPGVDGLEILTHLHSNPLTVNIPIIVCTILPQEELALTLGASAFLRKPINRESLLAILDRLYAEQERDSD